jgi:hypothetical protein
MNLIGKFVAAVRAAFSYQAAQNHTAKRKFSDATRFIEKTYSIMQYERPSTRAPIGLNILSAQLAIETLNGPLALKSSQVSLQQARVIGSKYSAADSTYIRLYCEFLVKYCEFWRDGISTLELSRMVIPTDGVDRRLLDKYPPPQAKRSP